MKLRNLPFIDFKLLFFISSNKTSAMRTVIAGAGGKHTSVTVLTSSPKSILSADPDNALDDLKCQYLPLLDRGKNADTEISNCCHKEHFRFKIKTPEHCFYF